MHIPQDLTTLTSEQTEYCVAHLAALPLRELRKRQDIVRGQQAEAFRQKNDRAMANLRVREDHLIHAIDRKCFPTS